MDLNKTSRIIVGVLLLINTVTIFALLFLEPDALAVIFNFGIDINASNLGEVIAGLALSIGAGIAFLIFMFLAAIFNAIIYTVFGALTLALKRTKAMPIIVSIFTALALFIGARALLILTLGGYPSLILPLRVVSDVLVIALSILSIVLTFREGRLPRVEPATTTS
ncbi:MAG: hypothetical protein ACFE9R_17045 [Candidatus Hermodarchaeota archaeon]